MCSLLVSNNVKHVHFYGDSYMRHMYVATSIMLTKNYNDASHSSENSHCKYGNQFSEEASCRATVRPTIASCNGNVQLALHQTADPKLGTCGKGHLNFWSEGNHPVDFNYKTRLGVNDPVEYQKKYSDPKRAICPQLASGQKHCSLFWISTHARPLQKYSDENDDKVRDFNEKMRSFFEAGTCGKETGYIDVYNMTSNLVHHHGTEIEFMTFDTAHWGMEVNLAKVQIIMSALKQFTSNCFQNVSSSKN